MRALINPRLRKEFRFLLVPTCVAAVVACAIPVLGLLAANLGEGIFSALRDMAWFAFLGCVLFVAATPIGAEFHQRTMSMLISQPLPRSRLWQDKLLAASLAALVVCTLAFVAWFVVTQATVRVYMIDASGGNVITGQYVPMNRRFAGTDLFLFTLVVPTALCAAPYWALVTRTTVGSVTFTAASQFTAALVIGWITHLAHFEEGVAFPCGAVAYGLLCLYLGWRQFASLEVTDGPVQAAGAAKEETLAKPAAGRERTWRTQVAGLLDAAWMDRWLRCRSVGATRNLFRKELRLLKPVYQVGISLVACWFLVFALALGQPGKGYENLFDILVAFYIPLVFLLAGTVPVSEENTLGVGAWHLSLPISPDRQWAIKFITSAMAAVFVGWLLPFSLVWMTSQVLPTYSTRWVSYVLGLFLYLSTALFILGFWAATLVGSVVRAVPLALATPAVLFFAVVLGNWWARGTIGTSVAASALEALTGAPPQAFERLIGYGNVVVPGLVLVAAAWQSLRIYRRPDARPKPLVLYPCVLLLSATVLGAVIGVVGAPGGE